MKHMIIEFPSPSGASHFQILTAHTGTKKEPAVSVPFRGISFPNRIWDESFVDPRMFPSPSGASHFQILSSPWSVVSDGQFPSPSGASHFQIFTGKDGFRNPTGTVSVPFRGISFPNLEGVKLVAVVSVSVPFRGISFPNIVIRIGFKMSISFRPLPGHLISKYILQRIISNVVYPWFPSPSGASHFQILTSGKQPIRHFLFPSPSGASHFQIIKGIG